MTGVRNSSEVDLGAVAHGGHMVARLDGRVVFVRHGLPGERVRLTLTDSGADRKFWRADAVEVLGEPAAGRRASLCPVSGPPLRGIGGCGGCDWQHVTPQVQRELKADVITEALARFAGLEPDARLVVEELPLGAGQDPVAGAKGLGWRTRVRFAVDHSTGRLGLRAHRSHRVVPLTDCPLAHPGVLATGVLSLLWPSEVSEVDVSVAAETGESLVVVIPADEHAGLSEGTELPRPHKDVSMAVREPDGALLRLQGRTWLAEQAAGRTYRVTGGGFWQVHPAAADTLVASVLDMLQPRAGEHAADLYGGVGLFAGALAPSLGPSGSVVAVESDPRAAADARRNLHEHPTVTVVGTSIDHMTLPPVLDLVVLDPPRKGAGAAVVAQIAAAGPRAIAYVACDPVALARDIATFAGFGYHLAELAAYDTFPTTQHVECVALLERDSRR